MISCRLLRRRHRRSREGSAPTGGPARAPGHDGHRALRLEPGLVRAVVIGGLAFWGVWSIWPPGRATWPPWSCSGYRRAGRDLAGGRPPVAPSPGGGAGGGPGRHPRPTRGCQIHARQYYTTDSAAFNQVAAHCWSTGRPYTTLHGLGGSASWRPRRLLDLHGRRGPRAPRCPTRPASFLIQVPALAARLPPPDRRLDGPACLAGHRRADLRPAPDPLRWIGPCWWPCPSTPTCSAPAAPTPPSCPSWSWPSGGGTGSVPAGGPAWPAGSARSPSGWPARSNRPPGSSCPSWSSGCSWRPGPRDGGRSAPWSAYLALVAGVFLAVNLPFIVWHPGLGPRHRAPLRQAPGRRRPGPGHAGPPRRDPGGLDAPALGGRRPLVLLSLLAALVVWYPGMKRIWMLLLPAGLLRGPPEPAHLPARPLPGGHRGRGHGGPGRHVPRPARRTRRPAGAAPRPGRGGAGGGGRGGVGAGLQLAPPPARRAVGSTPPTRPPARLGDRRRAQHHRPDPRPPTSW